MTTQPHFTEADGAANDRDQYADPARADRAADPLATPTQPLEREFVPETDRPVDRETVSDADRPSNRDQVAETAQPVDRQQVPETARPVEQPRSHAAESDVDTDDSLFASSDLSGLRSRWDDVQAGFVDDPRKCVQTADGLVSDTVAQLTNGFSEARSRLEEQWSRGEDVSTEDLRLALKRYRAFFDRLLAV
jgi:hypothetical protein